MKKTITKYGYQFDVHLGATENGTEDYMYADWGPIETGAEILEKCTSWADGFDALDLVPNHLRAEQARRMIQDRLNNLRHVKKNEAGHYVQI